MRIKHPSLYTCIILTLLSCSLSAQYKLSIQNSMWQDTTLILGAYLGDKMLVTDSAHLDKRGEATFKADTLLPQGMYTIYFPDKSFFDLLVGEDQTMKLRFPTKNLATDVEIEGSIESKAFAAYQKFMGDMQTQRKAVVSEYQPHIKNADSLAIARKKMDQLNTLVEQKWQQEITAYPNTFYAAIIRSFIPPKSKKWNLPPSRQKDSLTAILNYKHSIAHYFDNIPLDDPRFWRTPFHQKKIESYLSKQLIPVPDSIIPHALDIIERSKTNPTTFRYTSSLILNFAVKSEIMGMESLSVAVAKKSYLSGDATWADSTLLAKLADLVAREEPSLMGKTAHNLVMQDWESGYKSLYQIQSPYTVLIFWEPGCSHCKVTIPKLYHDIWLKYKSKGLAVFSVYTQGDKEEWTEFIIGKELFDWTHVYDPMNQSNFRAYYNVSVTPKIYLLDKDKKIIGKNIGVENLDKMLNRLYLYGKLY